MSTFYVDTNAAAGGNGTTQALTGANCAWDTVADVNAASFSAGDSVLFNRGCVWYEQLTVPSSGSSGSVITFGAYGTGNRPRFSSSIYVDSWTKTDGKTNVYEKSIAGTVGNTDAVWVSTYGTVYENLQWMTKRADVDLVDANAGSCFYDAAVDKVYIHTFASNNPNTNGSLFWFTTNFSGVCTNGKDYLVVENIDCYFPASYGVVTADYTATPWTTSDHVTIQNVEIYCTPHDSFGIVGTNITVDSCSAIYSNGDNGAFVVGDLGAAQDVQTSDVVVSNCEYKDNTIWGGKTPSAFIAEFAIQDTTFLNNKITGAVHNAFCGYFGNGPTNVTIDGLTVEGSGSVANYLVLADLGTNYVIKRVVSYAAFAAVHGIFLDAITGATITQNHIGATDGGVTIGNSTGISIHYNAFSNISGSGIYLTDGTGHHVYNNSFYAVGSGVSLGAVPSADATTIVKNNAFLNCTANFTPSGVTQVIDYNIGYGHTDWGGGGLSLAVYQSVGLDVHSTEADPLFISTTDFHLQSSSPAINAGVMIPGIHDVSGGSDCAGNYCYKGSLPDIGAYEYQPVPIYEWEVTLGG